MSDYSLVPVDHQPDFENVSLVPVEHDPFSDGGAIQQAPTQLAQIPIQPPQIQPQVQQAQFQQPQAQTQSTQPEPQQLATGGNQPGVDGAPTGGGPSGPNTGADQEDLVKVGSSRDRGPGDVRQRIVDLARGHVGSGAWDFYAAKGNFGVGKDKCNLFVYEVLKDAGASPGLPNGHFWNPYPPTAANWADSSFAIPGWRVLSSGESPQPGDVVGQRIQWPNGATGHVMIVGPNANFIGVGESEKVESVASKMMGGIYPNPNARPGGLLVYRRYEP